MGQQIRNTVRAIIIDNGKLLIFRLAKAKDWYCLPGGGIDFGEHLEQALVREMSEETGIKPAIGKLLMVQDMVLPEAHSIEFFYFIKNSSDYINIDFSKTTHGFEIAEAIFVDVTTTDKRIFPSFLKELIPKIIESGPDNFTFQVIEGKLDK